MVAVLDALRVGGARRMAQTLGPVCDHVVLAGGGLLLSNPNLMDVLATEDVDAIVEAAGARPV